MNTGDHWWREQRTLRVGGTLLPIILSSDATHLTNFSGDKKAWPIYLTLGNLDSRYRNKPSNHAVITLALLPVPPKKKGLSSLRKAQIDRKIQDVLELILKPLQTPQVRNGILMECGDGHTRLCYPRLTAWVADHMEHVDLLGLIPKACPVCEVPPDQLQDWAGPEQYPQRDYKAYADEWYEDSLDEEALQSAAATRLKQVGVTSPARAFLELGFDVASLHKPDILHGI